MSSAENDTDWNAIARTAGPYPLEAFAFVREGLNHTVQRVHDVEQAAEAMAGELAGSQSHHVTGQQLCMGLRDYAIDRYGMLAPAVLSAWNVRRTDDFGRIVFAMIEHGLMSKTAEDTLEDFRAVFDFDEAFARDELLRHVGRA